ncbi:MAG TPA: hypothetical protein PKZ32_15480 [Candidatus Melainabacteria bacterium]|nr:hypothetical protein [Candidatus Melainabacteria bacterium]
MADCSKKALFFFLTVTLLAGQLSSRCLAAAPVREAAQQSMSFNREGPLLEPMKDGASFIETMAEKVDRLNDYSLSFETRIFKKNSTVIDSGKLYFKKPKMMRVEETGEFNKGSVAVIQRDGKARAKGGGITGLLVLTLKPDDKMLDAANGDKMEDSDFASLVRILKERLHNGQSVRISQQPVITAGVSEPAYILELFRAAQPKTCLKRVWVSPVSYLPIRWDDYDYKDPCLSIWKDVRSNQGLSDDLFKL